MKDNNFNNILQDTRPYPEIDHKNELLNYVKNISNSNIKAQKVLAQELLKTAITNMLLQNNYLNLSVALSMANSRQEYQILWDTLDEVLSAQSAAEIQFIALPLVLIIGRSTDLKLNITVPKAELNSLLAQFYPQIKFNDLNWHNFLLSANLLADISIEQWFIAKQNQQNAELLLSEYSQSNWQLNQGQSVELAFVIGYTTLEIKKILQQHLAEMDFLMMQLWNKTLNQKDATIFANPLAINSPLQALVSGSQVSQRMNFDIFVANAVRTIRLNNFQVAVVIGTKEGGSIEIRIEPLQQKEKPMFYSWHLSPSDEFSSVVFNLLELLRDCKIENVWLLQQPLMPYHILPDFHTAITQDGLNPFVTNLFN